MREASAVPSVKDFISPGTREICWAAEDPPDKYLSPVETKVNWICRFTSDESTEEIRISSGYRTVQRNWCSLAGPALQEGYVLTGPVSVPLGAQGAVPPWETAAALGLCPEAVCPRHCAQDVLTKGLVVNALAGEENGF